MDFIPNYAIGRQVGYDLYSVYKGSRHAKCNRVKIENPAAKDYAVFNDPKILFLFLVTSVVTGWLVCRFVEKPVQRYLRSKFNRPPARNEIKQPSADILSDNGPATAQFMICE